MRANTIQLPRDGLDPRAEMDPSVGWNNLLVELFWPKSGLVQVMKNLESHEI